MKVYLNLLILAGLALLHACHSINTASPGAIADQRAKPDLQFDIRIDRSLNLHHQLLAYTESAGSACAPDTEFQPAVQPGSERIKLQQLASTYLRGFCPTSLVRNEDLRVLTTAIATRSCDTASNWAETCRGVIEAADGKVAEDKGLAPRLALSRSLEEQLELYGHAMGTSVLSLFDANEPDRAFPVEIVEYAGPHGAYSLLEPRIFISPSFQREHPGYALEILYHEASHSKLVSGKLEQLLRDAFESLKCDYSHDLLHSLLFFIPGEAAKEVLGESYVPYAQANNLYPRLLEGIDLNYSDFEEAFSRHLRGKADLDSAVYQIANRYCEAH